MIFWKMTNNKFFFEMLKLLVEFLHFLMSPVILHENCLWNVFLVSRETLSIKCNLDFNQSTITHLNILHHKN